MLYFLSLLKEEFILFNVFKYITFRSFGAGVTAFLLSIIIGRKFISYLRKRQFSENIRTDGPPGHKIKAGTPTMGGAFIVLSILLSTIIWVNIFDYTILLTLFFIICFSFIGFADDWYKLKRGKGMRAKKKFILQIVVGTVFISLLLLLKSEGFTMSVGVEKTNVHNYTSVILPFFKNIVINMGILYIPFALFVVVGSSNAVNLTDGLDGLAIGSMVIAVATYTIFSYLSGNFEFSRYLQIPYIPSGGELAIFLSAIGGASLGFLWYNSHPAEIFMGDVGSLSLGAAIGFTALVIKQELLLVIVGGLFLIEACSVMLQVASFKLYGKRIFKMAPLHHHFELSGWSESKVVIRFWIISILLSLIAMSTLKLR